MARILLLVLILGALYAARGWRKKIFGRLCSKLYERIAVTNRWLYVSHNGSMVNEWRYYTSQVTGKGNTGDDIIWSLVRWPSLKPIDSFTMRGVVGMESALHESTAKLDARWNVIHNPDLPVGPVPARGLMSKRRRACARVLLALAGGPISESD